MNWWSRSIEHFINPKEREDPEKHMKARFFIGSTYVLFLFCVLTMPYFVIVLGEEIKLHPEIFWGNIVGIVLTAGLLFFYKRYGGRIIIVNIFAVLLYGGLPGTYSYNGGIYSPDNVWAVTLATWVFLVGNRLSGMLWMGFSLCILVFFYYAELTGQHNFLADAQHFGADYYFFNYFAAGIFLLVIVSLYEQSKQRFVRGLKESKTEIELQKKVLESQKEDILSSINYAKRIQYAVLPHEESILRSIPLSFILYRARDIVSGDFFWFHEIDRDNYIIVCADCTGHGVPGAMMTVIGSSLLNQTVVDNKVTEPSKILLVLDSHINIMLKQQKEHQHQVQDGMDLALLKVNKLKKEFTFTSAKRPAVFIRNKQMQELKGSKFSLGGMISGCKTFQEITMNYQDEDVIYFYTDGYTDQFGGEKGKKYSSRRLKEKLLSIHRLPMNEQKQQLEKELDNWKGRHEQVDDIQVIGIRF